MEYIVDFTATKTSYVIQKLLTTTISCLCSITCRPTFVHPIAEAIHPPSKQIYNPPDRLAIEQRQKQIIDPNVDA